MAIMPSMRSFTQGGAYGEPDALFALSNLLNEEKGDFSRIRNPLELERAMTRQQTMKEQAALEGLRASTRKTGAEAGGFEQETLNINPEYARPQRWKDIEQADLDLRTRGLQRARMQRQMGAETGKVPLDIAASPEAALAGQAEERTALSGLKSQATDPDLAKLREVMAFYDWQKAQMGSPMNFQAGTAQFHRELPASGAAPAAAPIAGPPVGGGPGQAPAQPMTTVSVPLAVLQQKAIEMGMSPDDLIAAYAQNGTKIVVAR